MDAVLGLFKLALCPPMTFPGLDMVMDEVYGEKIGVFEF